MPWIVVLSLRAILSSIIGSSFYAWFKNTKMGVWVQVRVDNTMSFLAERYDINIASREEKWLQQYPNLAERIKELEAWSHPPIEKGGATELKTALEQLQQELEALKESTNVKKVAVKKTRRKNNT